jgi:hypothetical protein
MILVRPVSRRALPLGLLLAVVCAPVAALRAQETNWIASRTSADLHEVDCAGRVLRRIALSANAPALRSVHLAPDGKLWVVNFGQAYFTIVDPAIHAGPVNVTNRLGSPYEIAFDAQGHAWVSGGTGVVEYDQGGAEVATWPLAAAAPLGIAVDGLGNKWIAHRTAAPGSISRISAGGVVTNHVPPTGGIQPTRVLAGFGGVGTQGHIWVVGDNASGDVYEFDGQGNFLGLVATGSQLGSIAQDTDLYIWAGSFGNGNLFKINPASRTIANTFQVAPSITGLAVDCFGNLWATVRTPAPAASELRRIDRQTGAVEVAATIGIGAQSNLSTLHHHARVVDPRGDLDDDFIFNETELFFTASPRDACSRSSWSVAIRGPSRIGTSAVLHFGLPGVTGSFAYFHAFSTAIVPPGSGLVLPGIPCEVRLAQPTILSTGFRNGPVAVALPIPNDPGLAGMEVFLQALASLTNGPMRITNVSALKVWL